MDELREHMAKRNHSKPPARRIVTSHQSLAKVKTGAQVSEAETTAELLGYGDIAGESVSPA